MHEQRQQYHHQQHEVRHWLDKAQIMTSSSSNEPRGDDPAHPESDPGRPDGYSASHGGAERVAAPPLVQADEHDLTEPDDRAAGENGDTEALAGVEITGAGSRAPKVRSRPLAWLLVLAVFYTIYLARGLFLPVLAALILYFVLSPVMRSLKRLGLPEPVGAGVVLLGFLVIILVGGTQLVQQGIARLQAAPEQVAALETKLSDMTGPMDHMERLRDQLQRLGRHFGGRERGLVVDVSESPGIEATIVNALPGFLATMTMTLILLYFLLGYGRIFLGKLIKILPNFDDKKRAVEISNQIEENVSIYLATVTLINCGLGLAVGLAMLLLGMSNPLLWGVMAAFLNFIPYIGAVTGVTIITVAAVLSLDPIGYALLVPVVYFALTSMEGYFVTPTILGHRLTLNPLVIFLGLMLWGWLWGIAGAILAVPTLVAFKIFCDNIDDLSDFGEFLGKGTGAETVTRRGTPAHDRLRALADLIFTPLPVPQLNTPPALGTGTGTGSGAVEGDSAAPVPEYAERQTQTRITAAHTAAVTELTRRDTPGDVQAIGQNLLKDLASAAATREKHVHQIEQTMRRAPSKLSRSDDRVFFINNDVRAWEAYMEKVRPTVEEKLTRLHQLDKAAASNPRTP